MSKVAVLITTFNSMDWIDEQILSILNQSEVDVTVFASDDSSSDGTCEWLEALARQNTRVILLQKIGSARSASNNFYRLLRDVDLRQFEFVALADHDDIWLPSKLSRACTQLALTNADAYSSDVLAFWPNGRKRLLKKSWPQVKWDFLFESPGPGNTFVLSATLALKIQAVTQNYPEKIEKIWAHDLFIYAYARANGYRWIISETPDVLYRQHEQSLIGANVGATAFVNRSAKVLSGWGLSESYKIARAVGMADDSFVVGWSSGTRRGYLRLALSAGSCRRRFRDQVLFFVACLLLAVLRPAITIN